MKPRARLASVAAACAIPIATANGVTGGAPVAAVSTASNVSIYVYCATAAIKPVGMWFKADNGQQGWATWGASDQSGGQWFSFRLNSTITNANLSIGCGGTTQSWGKVMSGAIAVFRVPSQSFRANCSEAGHVCRLTT